MFADEDECEPFMLPMPMLLCESDSSDPFRFGLHVPSSRSTQVLVKMGPLNVRGTPTATDPCVENAYRRNRCCRGACCFEAYMMDFHRYLRGIHGKCLPSSP